MPSTVPSYEYDIFISYRQNDNRSGWVTEFVNHLNEELAATLKEPVSVYFDSNSHDGLLETHDIDRSLEGKLKCLIFIPIISQTYCDPKSFAWKNEFLVFKKSANEDKFGLKVKLHSGNVASRILPVRIHELDDNDKATLESEIGPLRSVDFIFKASGVNRPLLSNEDRPHDNQNKTFYRNQINKTANAVKELVTALRYHQPKQNEQLPANEPLFPPYARKVATLAGAILLFGIATFSLFYFGGVKSKLKELETPNSIAVLPFDNLSNDPDQDYFCDGTTEQVISSLARLSDLKVIARTSVLRYKNTTKSIAQIGKELNVTHILESSVRKSGDQIRVTAQLIAVSDESHLWAEDFDNKVVADIFQIQDEVAMKIASSLKAKLLPEEKEKLKTDKPSNPEAYEHYLKGIYIHSTFYAPHRIEEDFQKAEKELKLAIHLDTSYASAYAALADLYDTRSKDPETNIIVAKYADFAYRLNPTLPYALVAKHQIWHERVTFESDSSTRAHQLDSAYKYITQAFKAAPNDLIVCSEFAYFLGNDLGLYEMAITLSKHAIRLNPTDAHQLARTSNLFYNIAENANSTEYANDAVSIDKNNLLALMMLFRINCDQKKYQQANEILEKMKIANPSPDLAEFGEAYLAASRGDRETAIRLSKNKSPFFHLDMFVQLKMKPEAISGIQKSLEENWRLNYFILRGKRFDFLKSDPRFEKILVQTKAQYEARLKKYGSIDIPKD